MYALNALGDEEGVVRVGEQLMKVAAGDPGRCPRISIQTTIWHSEPARRACKPGCE